MEAAIYNGFSSIIPKLLKLYCVKHLKDRDEKAIDTLHEKGKIASKLRGHYKEEILWAFMVREQLSPDLQVKEPKIP